MLHKLEEICPREILTEEQKSVVGGMGDREFLNSELQVPFLLAGHSSGQSVLTKATARGLLMALERSPGEWWHFLRGEFLFERDPLQPWLPLVREWLHLHPPGSGHGSSGRTGSAVETSGSTLGSELGFGLLWGCVPWGGSAVAVAQPLPCLEL